MKRLLALVFCLSLGMLASAEVTNEKVNFGGWPNSIRLSNGTVELVATTDVGPRIIRFALVGGDSVFKVWPDQVGKKGGDDWRIYGGHRFWHAPEDKVRTYQPDNDPVTAVWKDGVLTLTQKPEARTGMQKEVEIVMHPTEARVEVRHRLTNHGLWPVEAAPWALSVMQGPGRAILPQEPASTDLLPVRPIAMWGYTDMQDPRWTWGTRFIQLKCDPANKKAQKLGVKNTLGWVAYQAPKTLFIKRLPYVAGAVYPDFGCNNELYTNGDMLEMESVGPLKKLEPGETVEHVEVWYLFRYNLGTDETDINDKLVPLMRKLK